MAFLLRHNGLGNKTCGLLTKTVDSHSAQVLIRFGRMFGIGTETSRRTTTAKTAGKLYPPQMPLLLPMPWTKLPNTCFPRFPKVQRFLARA